jgi:RES domain-containing protein
VYRVSKTQYAKDRNGTGARLNGGRWNHIGTSCIYTSSSRALAILEFSVNVNIEFIPGTLSLAVFEINDKMIRELYLKELPDDWAAIPAPTSTKDLGTALLQQGTPVIKLPSTVVKEEHNYLLNPMAGPDCFQLVQVKAIVYDMRIKY